MRIADPTARIALRIDDRRGIVELNDIVQWLTNADDNAAAINQIDKKLKEA